MKMTCRQTSTHMYQTSIKNAQTFHLILPDFKKNDSVHKSNTVNSLIFNNKSSHVWDIINLQHTKKWYVVVQGHNITTDSPKLLELTIRNTGFHIWITQNEGKKNQTSGAQLINSEGFFLSANNHIPNSQHQHARLLEVYPL